MSGQRISIDDLNGYVDDQLSPERWASVHAALHDDPSLASQAAAIQAQNQAINSRFEGYLSEPLPRHLVEAVQTLDALSFDTPKHSFRRIGPYLLAASLGVVSTLLGFWLSGNLGTMGDIGQWVTRAKQVHHALAVAYLRAEPLSQQSPSALSAHLSAQLSQKVVIPDLSEHGLSLRGGQIVPGPGQRLEAVAVYRDVSGAAVSLYIAPHAFGRSVDEALQFDKRLVNISSQSLRAWYWIDNDQSCIMQGEMQLDKLRALSLAAYDKIEHKTENATGPPVAGKS